MDMQLGGDYPRVDETKTQGLLDYQCVYVPFSDKKQGFLVIKYFFFFNICPPF